jgi:excisionase family DNA binding protein
MTLAKVSQQETKSDRPDGRSYTIAQAAQKLQVHRTTVQRWISSGKLRAYRVGTGTRTVRILERDLETVITPANETREEVTRMKGQASTQGPVLTRAPARRLTDAEIKRGLAALAEARAFRERLRAERGGEPLPSSADVIRDEREERSRRL